MKSCLLNLSRPVADTPFSASMVSCFGKTFPTFSRLVHELKLEQAKTDFIINNVMAQAVGALPKRVYRNRQQRLYDLVSNYANRSNLQFLRAVAHNISF